MAGESRDTIVGDPSSWDWTNYDAMVCPLELRDIPPWRVDDSPPAVMTYKPVAKKARPVAERGDPKLPMASWPDRLEPDMTSPRVSEAEIEGMLGEVLTAEEKEIARGIIREHHLAFASRLQDRGHVKEHILPPVVIETTPHVPWKCHPMALPHALMEHIISYLKDQMAVGIMELCRSPYAARWFVLVKKDGNLRSIQDLQPLNRVTLRYANIPPRAEDVAARYACCVVYSVFDCLSFFDQIYLALSSRDLTAVLTPLGLARKTTLPMGWTNSVAYAQQVMDIAFRELIPRCAEPYVDDLPAKGHLVTEFDETEVAPGVRRSILAHLEDVRRILQLAIEAGITFSVKKAKIGTPSIEVMGHVVDATGRRPRLPAVKAILDWALPTTLTQVRGFLGAAGFYRQNIPAFSIIAEPLINLTRMGVKFDLGEGSDGRDAFEALKRSVAKALTLGVMVYGLPERPPILTVDAGPLGEAGMVGQDQEDGQFRAVACYSGLFRGYERNYSQHKKELCGVVRNLKRAYHHLMGAHFVLRVDAKALIGAINNPLLHDATMLRWVSYVRLFDCTLEHIAGKDNVVCDALSRQWTAEELTEADEEEEDMGDGTFDEALDKWTMSVQEGGGNVWDVMALRLTGRPEPGGITRWKGRAASVRARVAQLTVEIPIPFDEDAYADDPRLLRIGRYLMDPAGVEASTTDRAERVKLRRSALQFFLRRGHLFKRGKPGTMPRRCVGRLEERREIIARVHDVPEDGNMHRGVLATYHRAADRYYWGTMFGEVEAYVKSCGRCQRNRVQRVFDPASSVLVAPILFRFWHMDYLKIGKASSGHVGVAVFREALSGWLVMRPTTSMSAKTVLAIYNEDIRSTYGPAEGLVIDGGELKGPEIEEEVYRQRLRLHVHTAYNPQAAGFIERGHQPILHALRMLDNGTKQDWPRWYRHVQWADRTTARRPTGEVPYEMVFGQQPVLPIEYEIETLAIINWRDMSTEELLAARAVQLARRQSDLDVAAARLNRTRHLDKEMLDGRRRQRVEELKVGDLVLVRDSTLDMQFGRKLDDRYKGPYKVVGVQRGGTYELAELDGTRLRKAVAGHRVVKYRAREEVGKQRGRPIFYPTDADDDEGSATARDQRDKRKGQRAAGRQGRRHLSPTRGVELS